MKFFRFIGKNFEAVAFLGFTAIIAWLLIGFLIFGFSYFFGYQDFAISIIQPILVFSVTVLVAAAIFSVIIGLGGIVWLMTYDLWNDLVKFYKDS